MSNIGLVKKLKDITFASLKDCVSALKEANNNIELACDILRKKAIIKSQSRALHEAREGKIVSVVDNNYKAIFEINSETDFVARNNKFNELCNEIINIIKEKKFDNINDLKNIMSDNIAQASGILGEKIEISNFASCNSSTCEIYIHQERIGVIVDCDMNARDVAMQIASMDPKYTSRDDISEKEKEKELNIFIEECKSTNIAEDKIQFIAQNKLNKYFSEIVLLEQKFIKDQSKKVSDISGKIRFFRRFEIKK